MAPKKGTKRAGGDEKDSVDKKIAKSADVVEEITNDTADENQAPKAKPRGRAKKEPVEVVKRELRQRPEKVELVSEEKSKPKASKAKAKNKNEGDLKENKKTEPKKKAPAKKTAAEPKKKADVKKKDTKKTINQETDDDDAEESETTNGDASLVVEHCTS